MLNAKTEYACLALLQLAAEHAAVCPQPVKQLASAARVPEGFLVQILQELKRAGLVTSTRGKSGGYRLARDPSRVSLGEVIELFEGVPERASRLDEPTPMAEVLAEACSEAQQAACDRLRCVTLAELAARSTSAVEPMYFI